MSSLAWKSSFTLEAISEIVRTIACFWGCLGRWSPAMSRWIGGSSFGGPWDECRGIYVGLVAILLVTVSSNTDEVIFVPMDKMETFPCVADHEIPIPVSTFSNAHRDIMTRR